MDGNGFLDNEFEGDENENRRRAEFGSGNGDRVFDDGCIVRAKGYETSDIVFGEKRDRLLLELVEQFDTDVRNGSGGDPPDELLVDEFPQRLQEEKGEHKADEKTEQRKSNRFLFIDFDAETGGHLVDFGNKSAFFMFLIPRWICFILRRLRSRLI